MSIVVASAQILGNVNANKIANPSNVVDRVLNPIVGTSGHCGNGKNRANLTFFVAYAVAYDIDR